jgi:hypothetical protein
MLKRHTLFVLAVFNLAAILKAAEPARRALLVGINTYKWSGAVHKDSGQDFDNLEGAAGDAIWLKSILTSKYGFRDEDVVVLTDLAATRDAILDTFRSHLIAKSAPGDVALFYYAGHGSYRGTGADQEDTIMPADSRDPDGKVFDIASSDLHVLFVALLEKTRNVTSILDSCYSDSTVRGIGLKRSAPPDNRVRKGPIQTQVVLSALAPITPVVRISASRADQESEEYTEFTADGKRVQHGLMSFELFHELQAADDQTTWRDVMDRTRTEVAKRNSEQDPQLEAPNDDTRIFGGVGLAAKEPFFLLTPQGRQVQVNAGSMAALAVGAGLDVFPPGTREFTGQPLARITVTNVGDFVSQATVATGPPAGIPEGARAVVRSRPATSFRFRILFDGDNTLVAAVHKSALDTVAGAVESPNRSVADAVVRFADGNLHTEKPNGFLLSPPVPANEDDAVDHEVRLLREWARWQQLLTTEGGRPVIQLKVTDDAGGSPTAVASGTFLTVALCNTGTRPYWTSVVYFSSDGAMTPLDLATNRLPLAAGECQTGGRFNISVEAGKKSAVEFFKAFATIDRVDLEPFTSAAIRGDTPDPSQWSAVTKSFTVTKH